MRVSLHIATRADRGCRHAGALARASLEAALRTAQRKEWAEMRPMDDAVQEMLSLAHDIYYAPAGSDAGELAEAMVEQEKIIETQREKLEALVPKTAVLIGKLIHHVTN